MMLCGIDPGLTGALALIRETAAGDAISFFDTPVLEIKTKQRTHRVIDIAEIANILMRELGRNAEAHVYIEKVSAAPIGMKGRGNQMCPVCHRTPQPGATSTFNFGMGFGMWQGVLAGLQLPVTLVHPRTWKSAVMKDMGQEKGASIIRAKQLYPMASPSLNLVKHHGRADALLIAHWGRGQRGRSAADDFDDDDRESLFGGGTT